jgi:hypothetical protein
VVKSTKRKTSSASVHPQQLFSANKRQKKAENDGPQLEEKQVEALHKRLNHLVHSEEYQKLIAHLKAFEDAEGNKHDARLKKDLLAHKNGKLEVKTQMLAKNLEKAVANSSQLFGESADQIKTKQMKKELLAQKNVKLEAKVQALADTLEKTVADLPQLFGRSKHKYALPGLVSKEVTDKAFAARESAENKFLKTTATKLETYLKHLKQSKGQPGDNTLGKKILAVNKLISLAQAGNFNNFIDEWDKASKTIEKHRVNTYLGVKFTLGSKLNFSGKKLVADIDDMKAEFVKSQKVLKRY